MIKSGIKRCFIGSYDSNPLVSGQGIKKLRENNIEVEVGIQRETCDSLNKIFFKLY